MLRTGGLFLGCIFIGFFFFFFGRWMLIRMAVGPLISPEAISHFSLFTAPTDSLNGKIATYSGSVYFLSRVADKPAPVSSLLPLQQGEEVIASATGLMSFTFGSATASLENNTDIAIIQTLPADMVFEEKSGTAVFQNVLEKAPMSIRGLDLLLRLTQPQTKVVVSVDTKKEKVTFQVESGEVTVAYNDTSYTSHVLKAANGTIGTFDNNTKKLLLQNY
ncbi:MAG TPA: hypothetical protein VN711_01990 [Candidatus Saccharimonadales bacterium]|nr:hypothetical protein [Candidatus Saccharimonadales bacterium]